MEIVAPTVTLDDEGFESTSTSSPDAVAPAAPAAAPVVAAPADPPPADDTIDDDDAAAAAAAAAPVDEQKPKKPSKPLSVRTNEQLAKLNATTRELREAERQRDAVKAETERLRTAPAAPAAAKPEDALPPRPLWTKYQEDDKDFEEYEKDLIAWEAKRDDAQLKAADARAEARARAVGDESRTAAIEQQASEQFTARLAAAKEKHPDFDEVMKAVEGAEHDYDLAEVPYLRAVVKLHPAGTDVLYHLATNAEDAALFVAFEPTVPMIHALKDSEDPLALLTALVHSPDVVKMLGRMAPLTAAKALGRFEEQLTGAKNGSPPAAPSVSKAAPPPGHRAGSRVTVERKDPDDEDDLEAYVGAKNKEEGLPAARSY